jgi:hypothetical protein
MRMFNIGAIRDRSFTRRVRALQNSHKVRGTSWLAGEGLREQKRSRIEDAVAHLLKSLITLNSPLRPLRPGMWPLPNGGGGDQAKRIQLRAKAAGSTAKPLLAHTFGSSLHPDLNLVRPRDHQPPRTCLACLISATGENLLIHGALGRANVSAVAG